MMLANDGPPFGPASGRRARFAETSSAVKAKRTPRLRRPSSLCGETGWPASQGKQQPAGPLQAWLRMSDTGPLRRSSRERRTAPFVARDRPASVCAYGFYRQDLTLAAVGSSVKAIVSTALDHAHIAQGRPESNTRSIPVAACSGVPRRSRFLPLASSDRRVTTPQGPPQAEQHRQNTRRREGRSAGITRGLGQQLAQLPGPPFV